MRDGFLVVDAHAHIDLTDRTASGGRPAHRTTEDQLRQMDDFGTDAACVIAHAWRGWTLDQYQHEHDVVAVELAKSPRRLFGALWADPNLGAPMVREVRRAIEELGYRAIKLHPVYAGFNFDGPVVDPIVEVAAEHGCPVIAHLDLRWPGCEPWRMVNLASRYPTVNFVMAHMGRDVKALQDSSFVYAAADVPNVYLEGSSTATDSYGTFQAPAEILGSERVLYASDAGPFHHPAINMLKLDLLDMPVGAKANIYGLNELRLLGIPPETVERTADRARGSFQTALGERLYPVPATAIQARPKEVVDA
jgi:predicted TIM-barrel fold metal-dependent hydrolase